MGAVARCGAAGAALLTAVLTRRRPRRPAAQSRAGQLAAALPTALPGTPVEPERARHARRGPTSRPPGRAADRRARRRDRRRDREGAPRAARVAAARRARSSSRASTAGRSPTSRARRRARRARRSRRCSSTTARARARGVDGLPGAVVDGARLPRRVRAHRQRAVGVDPAGAAVPRRRSCAAPWRMLHLDLLVLSAFSASTAFFNAARIDVVGAAALPAARLPAGRACCGSGCAAATRRRAAGRPLRLLVPVALAGVAVIFLLGFRVALNVDELQRHRRRLRGRDRRRPDRRRQRALRRLSEGQRAAATRTARSSTSPTCPSSRRCRGAGAGTTCRPRTRAAIAFDLLACLLLFLIGRRVRGPDLGVLLAYAWVTYPFTLYALMSNSNDTLVAALVLAAVLGGRQPRRRAARSSRWRG